MKAVEASRENENPMTVPLLFGYSFWMQIFLG